MWKRKKNRPHFPCSIEVLHNQFKSALHDSPDLEMVTYTIGRKQVAIFYISYQINKKELHKHILSTIVQLPSQHAHYQHLLNTIPIAGRSYEALTPIIKSLLQGHCCVYIEHDDQALTYAISEVKQRSVDKAENESLIYGPQLSFTESLETNLNIVQWRLNTGDLEADKLMVGERIPTEVRVVYLKSLANEENVQTVTQRINDLVIDDVIDTSVLAQLIEDKSTSMFPQSLQTELPDRLCYEIKKGRIGILLDKSPHVLIVPISIFNLLESTEDVYMRWNMGTFLRILRIIATILSILLTPAYVAALTYHYEVIPSSLLVSLGQSRSNVPFPPLIEALLLELVIELLREAGVRLPTKVGQTMGIVGGIVLGQAAVQAGFTSNILIIIIALSALGSFTAPNYMMGTAIRIIRFPTIIMAGLWGFIGIFAACAFFIIHLLRLSSLGRPYLEPIYPFILKDVNNNFFRLPWNKNNTRPLASQPKDSFRFSSLKAKEKKDIDE